MPRAPAFAREGSYELLDAPFLHGVLAVSGGPGEAVLSARLNLPLRRSTLVYWEVGCDVLRERRERHGLMRCGSTDFRVSLTGLEPGRPYWYRCWAGGHWSRVGQFFSLAR